MKYDPSDEIYAGLPKPNVRRTLNEYLTDEESSPKRFNRTMSFAVTAEQFQAAQEMVVAKGLPFNGNMSDMLRHALGAFTEAVLPHLPDDIRTIFSSLMAQQRRLTRERIIVTIDEVIDQQVDVLRFWTQREKWGVVVRDLSRFMAEVDEYPEAEWREHLAITWLRHDGVKSLMRTWAERMQSESPGEWGRVRRFVDRMEEWAGV